MFIFLLIFLSLPPMLEGLFIISGRASQMINGLFYIDLSPPFYSYANQSAYTIITGSPIALSAYWLDNVQVDYAWLATNETGMWENKTGVYGSPIKIANSSGWSNFTWSSPGFSGTVYWRIYANDTRGNMNSTPIMTFYAFQSTPTPPESGDEGGGGGGGPPASANQTNVSQTPASKFIDTPRSVYVELYQGETAGVSVYILNNLNSSRTFSGYLTSGLRDIVFFKALSSLYLGPGGRGELSLQVQVPENMKPGNYSGELNVSAGQLTDRIPIIIRVLEAKKGLLDLRIEPLQPIISPGGMENVNVSMYNLGQTGRINVRLILKVIDSNNTVVSEEEESVSVDTSLSSVVAIKVPEWASEGAYTIKAIAYYKGLENESMEAVATEKITVSSMAGINLLHIPIMGIKLWQLISVSSLAIAIAIIYHRRGKHHKAKKLKDEAKAPANIMEKPGKEERAKDKERFRLLASKQEAMLGGLDKDLSTLSESLGSMKEKGMETGRVEKKLSDIRLALGSGDSRKAQQKAKDLRNEMDKERENFDKEHIRKEKERAEKARKERERIQKEIERLDNEQARRDREEAGREKKEREKFEKEQARKDREELERTRKDERKEDEEEIIKKAQRAREKFEREQEQKHMEAVDRVLRKKEELERSRARWEKEAQEMTMKEKAAQEALKKKQMMEMAITDVQKKIDNEYAKLESQHIRKQAITAAEHKERPAAGEKREARPEPAKERPEARPETAKTAIELIKRKLAEETIPLKAKEKAKPEEEELKIEYEKPQKLFSFNVSGKQKEKIQQQKADMKIPAVPPAWMREGLERLGKDIERSEFRVSLLEERRIDVHKINRELDGVRKALHLGTRISEKELNSAIAMAAEISKSIDALENEAEERPIPGKIKQHPKNLPPAERTAPASAEEIDALTRGVKSLREEFELLQERIDIIPLEAEFTQIENALHFRKDMTRHEVKQMARQVAKINNGVELIKISIAYNWLQKELAFLEEELKTLRGTGAETGQHEKDISAIRALLRKELTLKDTASLKKMVEGVKAGIEKKKAKELKTREK